MEGLGKLRDELERVIEDSEQVEDGEQAELDFYRAMGKLVILGDSIIINLRDINKDLQRAKQHGIASISDWDDIAARMRSVLRWMEKYKNTVAVANSAARRIGLL